MTVLDIVTLPNKVLRERTHEVTRFDDDLQQVSEYDWIIEVIVENLEIKKQLFDKLEEIRKPATNWR